MALVIPPPVHLPQVQPQQVLQPKAEVVQLAQTRPIATQIQRAVPGTSRSRGGDGAKSREKQSATTGTEDKTAEVRQTQRQRKRDGITIDV
jgi:hypothetical protein